MLGDFDSCNPIDENKRVKLIRNVTIAKQQLRIRAKRVKKDPMPPSQPAPHQRSQSLQQQLPSYAKSADRADPSDKI